MAQLYVKHPGTFGGQCPITNEAGTPVGTLSLEISSFIDGSEGIVFGVDRRVLFRQKFNFGMWDDATASRCAIGFVEAAFPGDTVDIAGM